MIDSLHFHKQLGIRSALNEIGMPVSTFMKTANLVAALDDRSDNAVVWRKAAAATAEVLASSPRTLNKVAHNIMKQLAGAEEWTPAYRRIVGRAFEPMQKQAFLDLGGDALELTPGLISLLALGGAIGGGVLHYADKAIDEDEIKIEKNQARYNEYLRLVDELDRKVTSQANKERKAA